MKTKMQHAVALTGCLVAALPSISHAAEREQVTVTGYQMTAITDRAYGQHIIEGDYATVIERLAGRSRRFEATTNLCVAYTLSGQLEQAGRACAEALAISERNAKDAHGMYSGADRRDLAVALSNRGVVLAISGDVIGAVENFSRAVEMQEGLEPATNNLSRSMATATSIMPEVTS